MVSLSLVTRTILALCFVSIGAAMAKAPPKENPDADYAIAMSHYAKRNYKTALTAFEEMERKYPNYSKKKDILIMQAYLQYLNKEYDLVDIPVKQFVLYYGNQPERIYLDYLLIMSFYRQITGLSKSYNMLQNTYLALLSFISKYKDTPYAQDAQKKVMHLAAIIYYNEIVVGEFYQSRGDYFSAISRFNQILLFKPEGLMAVAYYRLYECYKLLGIIDVAEKYYSLFKIESKRKYPGLPFEITSSFYNISHPSGKQCAAFSRVLDVSNP